MSSILTEHGILHFETIGQGRPIVFLHGWINSWDVWRDAMMTLAGVDQRRVYALDFWGFGDSAKPLSNEGASFRLSGYVEMVHEFMDNLGIRHAPIAGHSMGGTVALKFALKYPERVQSVILVGSPIVGRSLNPFLKLAANSRIAKTVWRFPVLLKLGMRLLLNGDSSSVRQMISRDVKRSCLEAFFRSIGDLKKADLRTELKQLSMPVLGIYGRRDNIVSPANAALLTSTIDSAQVFLMNDSRHFPMCDEPSRFSRLLLGFLNSNSSN